MNIFRYIELFTYFSTIILRNHTVLVSESNKKIILNFARRMVNEKTLTGTKFSVKY